MKPDAPIPGQTPIDDLSGLKLKVRTQAELNAAEAENIRKAVVKYLLGGPVARRARFDRAWVLRLHAEMFREVWAWAGKVRTRELNLGSPAHQVERELVEMLADLKAWRGSTMPVMEQAARLHHRAVQIHPFLNGNGRWGRMLANVWLARAGEGLIEWPEATLGAVSTIQEEYLRAMKAADRGEYGPLTELQLRYVTAKR